jgi:Holliday junction resolvase RusA-like endonuclease
LFRIPEEQLKPAGLARKLRIEMYNVYKEELRLAAFEAGFRLAKEYDAIPEGYYMHVIFYIPVSKSWKKWKKEQMHLKQHRQQPDRDNLEKAFFDALAKKDEGFADVRATKLWYNTESPGWIHVKVRRE